MKALLISVLAGAALQPSPRSDPGVYARELQRCVVLSTTETDRMNFVRWMFSAISAHPTVAGMSTVTDEMRAEANRTAALLMERLILSDCRQHAINALKYEGLSAIEYAFRGLGEVAMGDLMSNPAVAAQLTSLDSHIDAGKWEALAEEVGAAVRQ